MQNSDNWRPNKKEAEIDNLYVKAAVKIWAMKTLTVAI